jgi:hypothetical protein
MVDDPEGYFAAARMRREREITSEAHKPAILAPGIVKMSVRGDEQDVERLIAKMRTEGIRVWRADSSGTRSGNEAGFQYFSVEVPRDADG